MGYYILSCKSDIEKVMIDTAERILLSSPHMSEEGFELEYIRDAFRKNWIAPLGENVTEFEGSMASFMGTGYPVALSAGTAALHLSMILAGVKAGSLKLPVQCQKFLRPHGLQHHLLHHLPPDHWKKGQLRLPQGRIYGFVEHGQYIVNTGNPE